MDQHAQISLVQILVKAEETAQHLISVRATQPIGQEAPQVAPLQYVVTVFQLAMVETVLLLVSAIVMEPIKHPLVCQFPLLLHLQGHLQQLPVSVLQPPLQQVLLLLQQVLLLLHLYQHPHQLHQVKM